MAKKPCTALIGGKEYTKHELQAAIINGELNELLGDRKTLPISISISKSTSTQKSGEFWKGYIVDGNDIYWINYTKKNGELLLEGARKRVEDNSGGIISESIISKDEIPNNILSLVEEKIANAKEGEYKIDKEKEEKGLPSVINKGWDKTTPSKTIKVAEPKTVNIKDLKGSPQNDAIRKAANASKKGNIPYIIDFSTLNSWHHNKYLLTDANKRYGYIEVEGDNVTITPFKVGEKFDQAKLGKPEQGAGKEITTEVGSKSVMPKEIQELYKRRSELNFTLNALKMQMGNKKLVGKSKIEYDKTLSELNSVENQISEYENLKPTTEKTKQKQIEPIKENSKTSSDYANYLLDLIEQKQKELGWKDASELRKGLAKQFEDRVKSDGEENRAISQLEELYMQYIPSSVRAESYQLLRKNFEKLAKPTETKPEKETMVGKTVTFEHAGSEKTGVVKSEDAKGNLEVEGTGANKGIKYTVKPKDATVDVEASKISQAKAELDSALKELRDITDLTKLGVKGVDPEKQAEAMYKVHKALVKYAKEYISKGINDIKKFAKDLGISVKNAQQAWDEALGKITYTKETVDYDLADITKTAIRRGINAREKMAELVKAKKDIGEAVKAFMDDAEIKGTLTARELKSLVKKAANITTDKQLDKFLDYADKVITDANFTEAVETLNSDRKTASKKRHNEKTGAVKKFLGEEIFDEDGNLLLDDATFAEYSEAVKALGKQIPDHSLMEARDASGKTLAERVSEQAAQNNPYSSMNTVTELMKAWSKLDDNIVDIDSYKAFARNVNKIRARLKELVNNGSITEDNYRNAIDNIYKLEDGKRKYEAKYATQIEQLKDAQLADAQAKMRNVDDSGLNSIQKSLWEEFKRNVKVNYAKLKGLEVADLDKLNTILDRMEGGFMPEYELRDIVKKISVQGKGKEVAKQVSGISKKLKGVSDDLRRVLLLNSPARYEGELGIADGSSLWNNVTGRTQKALQNYTKAAHDLYEKWYSGLPSFYKITSKKPVIIDRYGFEGKKGGKFVTTKREYDLTKTAIVRHMINHAAEMEAKGEKPVDFFGEQLKNKKEIKKKKCWKWKK